MKTVMVCSSKGGTGKTIIALNLAKKLSEKGKVGFFDSDIDSSNTSEYLNITENKIQVSDKKHFVPLEWQGIKTFAMSLLVDRDKAVSMDGSRYSQMVSDALQFTDWGELDYLVVDMPAGMGDVFRSTSILLAESMIGSIVVIQPMNVTDARRVIKLHQWNGVPILGLIENMSYFQAKKGAKKHRFFGKSKAKELCKEFGIEFLGEIPLSITLADNISEGNPILDDDINAPIIKACEKAVKAKVVTTTILSRFQEKLEEGIQENMAKIIGRLITLTNRKIDIRKISYLKGYTEQRPFDLVITDESGRKVLCRTHMRLRNGVLKILRELDEPEFEADMSYRTLARTIMGKRIVGRKQVDYDGEDAWLAGDIQVYGISHTPRVIKLFRDIFANEEIMNQLREAHGKTLEKWL